MPGPSRIPGFPSARLCAQNATQNQLDELYARADLVDKMMARQEPYSPEGVQEHSNFHLALARFSGYPLLARELEKVWFRQLMFFNWVSSTVNPVAPEWHRKLVDAIASREPTEADRVMREHVYFGHDHQMEVIRRIEEGVAPIEPQE
jgi:DNA-binding GntR family transcriptional regulator